MSEAIKKKFDNIKERTAAVFKKNIIGESSDASLPSSTTTPPPPPLESKMKSFMQGIKSNFTNEESGDVANIGSVGSSFNASIRAIKSKFGGNE